MEALVSVIIPLYNAEHWMENMVKNVVSQTLNNLEIILVNDGSTDKTLVLAERWARQDKRIRVLSEENSGPGAARNLGLSVSQGLYISFVDADDELDSEMLSEMYKLAKEYHADVVMCGYKEITIKNENDIVSPLKKRVLVDMNQERNNILQEMISKGRYGYSSLCNKLYSKKFLDKNGLLMDSKRKHGEDWSFNLQVFKLIDRFVVMQNTYYHYIHQNTDSLMISYRKNQFDLFLQGYREASIIAKDFNLDLNQAKKNLLYQTYGFMNQAFKCDSDFKHIFSKILECKELKKCYKEVNNIEFHIYLTYFLGFNLGINAVATLIKIIDKINRKKK